MKSIIPCVTLAVLCIGSLSGCGGGGGGYGDSGNAPAPGAAPPPSAPAPSSVGFTSYSKQMQAVDERELPWDIETVTFSFDGDQDPAAYDDILPPPG